VTLPPRARRHKTARAGSGFPTLGRWD
jgi:hypothetical protein